MRKIILFIFLISLTVSYINAQNDTVVIVKSNNKVIIGGQPYYVHIVNKGETLYSISKVYDVSQKEIAKENPEIFLGLQIGQALKIPITKINGNLDEHKANYIYHRVKKGQTLYSLSKKYNVSQEDIITCNPTVRYGINIDQIVKIPKSKAVVESYQKFPTNLRIKDTIKVDNDFIFHVVQKQETVFSLVRLYDITEDILFEHNPDAKNGLMIGQTLKIPKVNGLENESIMLAADKVLPDSIAYEKRTTIAYSDSIRFGGCKKGTTKQIEPYQIAVMLPFYLEKNDEEYYIDSSEVDDFGEKIYERVYHQPYYVYAKSFNFIEFYEGILLAVDSLKKTGLSINLHVYDTESDTSRIKEILDFPELSTMDLIIGPIFNHEVKLVSKFSKEHNIKMVSPLSDNLKLVDENPYLFQIYPSFTAQIEKFAEYVANFKEKNIVLVHNGDSLSYHSVQMVKDKIFSYISYDTILSSVKFKEVVFQDSINVFEHAIDKELENIFIVPSNEEAFVTDVINNLNTLKAFGENIKVVGLSRWQRFKNVDAEFYFNLNLSIATPFFIDYHKDDIKAFVLKYRDNFNTEPTQMAIHGYDVGLYFLSAFKDFGSDFSNCVYNYNIDLLQADYHFVKWYKHSGFENTGVYIVKYYDGYNIFRVDEVEKNQKEFFFKE